MEWKNLVEIFLVLLHRCPKLKWKKWRCEWEKEEKISVRNPKLCLLEKYSILLHFSYLKKNVSQILYEKSEKYRSILWQIPPVAKNGKKQLCHMFWNKTASQKMREMRTWWNWTTTSRTLCKTSVLRFIIKFLFHFQTRPCNFPSPLQPPWCLLVYTLLTSEKNDPKLHIQ